MKLIFRISDKTGHRVERVTLADHPLTIGRGWDNDIIVQDPFVDAEHLSISLIHTENASHLELADLQTTNGTEIDKSRLGAKAHHYKFGEPLKVGDTEIEIFDASTPVEKTAVRSFLFYTRERFNSSISLLWLTLAALLVITLDAQFLKAEPAKLSNALLTMLLTLASLFVWSLVFGFISKLLSGKSNMRAHWALACVSVVAITLLSWLFLVIRFNVQSLDFSQALTALVMGGIVALLLYALLTYSSYLGTRSKSLFSAFLVLAIISATYSDTLFKEPYQRWTAQGETEQANLPPAFMLRRTRNLDQYMQDSSRLFDDLDSAIDR